MEFLKSIEQYIGSGMFILVFMIGATLISLTMRILDLLLKSKSVAVQLGIVSILLTGLLIIFYILLN